MTQYQNEHIVGAGGHARVVEAECTAINASYPKYGVVAIGSPHARKREVEAHEALGWIWLRAVCEWALVFCGPANIGEGTQILAGAVVAVGAKIGKHVIINHNAVVDHDCVVGDYAHIAPCASLSGGVKVGEGAWIGAGARVVSGEVPPWKLVRANSVYPNDYTKGVHKLKDVK